MTMETKIWGINIVDRLTLVNKKLEIYTVLLEFHWYYCSSIKTKKPNTIAWHFVLTKACAKNRKKALGLISSHSWAII